MACYRPLKGYWSRERNPSGKRSIVFDAKQAFNDRPVDIPCGQCIGCRLSKSQQWAIRCVHEASLYVENCFLTLTYSDSNLPTGGSVCVAHFQNFMKRLRVTTTKQLRYFHCGEYGEEKARPHYHVCLFNYDFADREFHGLSRSGQPIYTSKELDAVWRNGHATVQDLTFGSAQYVAQYVQKKVNGKWKDGYYGDLAPEYATMSRRPGIGRRWLEKYEKDLFPCDFVVLDGTKMAVPKYYLEQIAREKSVAKVKARRQVLAAKRSFENSPARLKVREQVRTRRLDKLRRNYENGTESIHSV